MAIMMVEVARKKPLIGQRNRVKRLKFAKRAHFKSLNSFGKKSFSAMRSKFNIFSSDGRRMVYSKPNTSHHPKHTTPFVKHTEVGR
ncbi:hypothetical protein TNCV_1601341 [Trichonephila clavipes]|nr:hypothetical protein TNCV_1601341 [Trichonephila clavipes]